MALPAGIATTTITFGTAVAMVSARNLGMTVKFTPTTSLVWAATGTVLIADAEGFTADPGTQGSVTLINPDQAGFSDGNGNTIRNWGYKVEATYTDGAATLFNAPPKYITWAASDFGPIDLDQMIPVTASSGISVSMPLVTSVNGRTGDVTVSGGGGSGRSNRLAYLGDSITNFNAVVADTATSSHQNSRGFGHWLQVFSRQAFHVVGCFGYSGYTVAQIRTQLPNALGVNPGYLFLLAGVNSVGTNTSAASIISDFQAIYDACAAVGVTVIHATMWPAGSQVATPAQLATADAVNAWIVQQGGITPNVIVVPWHVAMIDPATGGARTNYCEDGTHPSSLGAAVMGRYAWNVLQPLVGISGSESLAYYNGDTSNLVTNPMFTGSGGNNGGAADPGLAADWFVTANGNIYATYSKVASVDGLGDWQQIKIAGGGGGDGDYIDLWNWSASMPTSGGLVNQSDTVFGQLEFETDADFVNASKFQLHVYDPSTSNSATALQAGDSVDTYRLGSIAGIIRTPPLIPGHSQLQMHLRVGGLTGGASATLRVRRASIKKLVTTDGLA